MTEPLSQIDKVGFAYDNTGWHLRDVSLKIRPGEFIGIIGPNGSGKSTLLKIAAGVLRPSTGRVLLMTKQISSLSRREIARHLGYLPQNVTSTFDYRVEEVVAMGRFPHLSGAGFLQPNDLGIIEHCLKSTETFAYRNRPASQLSGGERQRVLLAAVLAQEPGLLLLDEPTTGLDLHHQVEFFSLLTELTQKGIAVIVVTHDLNLASQYCHRLLLLNEGRTVLEGDVSQVVRQEILSDVYRQNVYVGRHPLTEKPVVLPRLRNHKKVEDKGAGL